MITPAILEKMYYYMCLTRAFDQKAINLQRTGRLGTFPSSKGQEGLFVGLGLAMDKNDCLCPYYRDQGALFARGASLARMLCYWGGMEIGNNLHYISNDMPICVPIASQTTYACGIALAAKIKQKNQVIFCTLGDGATSKGDFYEAMNMAAIHKLPIAFVINNNQYAISTHISEQTSDLKLENKGLSCNIPGEKINGCDITAVYKKLVNVRKYCLANGPLLIAADTFRLDDHTTADDAQRYLKDDYLNLGVQQDPIALFEKQHNINNKALILEKISKQIEQAVNEYLTTVNSENPFRHVFSNMPNCLELQMQAWESEHEI